VNNLKRKSYPPALRRGSVLFTREYTLKVFQQLEGWDPEFAQMFQRYVYGGLYDRNVIDQKTRELCAVAACTVVNALPQLETHIKAAIRVGATKREVIEVIMQMTVYCGFPYFLQAARLFDRVMAEWSPAKGRAAARLKAGERSVVRKFGASVVP